MNAAKSKKKIALALASMALPALLGFLLIMGVVFSAETKRAQDLIQSYAESVARGISAFFAEATAIASAATTLNSVQSLDWEAAGLELTGFIRAAPYIQRISLIDSNGYIYDAFATGPRGNRWQKGRRTEDDSDPDAEPISITPRPYFRALVTENTDGEFRVMTNEVYFPYVLGGKTFATTASIIKGGKAIGVVNVAQTAIELSQLYEEIAVDFLERFGREGHMYLVSYAGELVSRLEYNGKYDAYMDELFGSNEVVPVSMLGEDAATAIYAAARVDKLVGSFKINGVSHFIAGVRIENTPFAACLAVSKRQMLHAFRYIVIIAALYLLIVALIGCRAFFLLSTGEAAPPKGKGKPRGFRRRGAPKRHKGFPDHLDPPVLPLD